MATADWSAIVEQIEKNFRKKTNGIRVVLLLLGIIENLENCEIRYAWIKLAGQAWAVWQRRYQTRNLDMIMKTKGETRAGDVLQRMRDDILSCRLEPGQRLRFEALKDRYDVSFSTLREALARLSGEGLVISEGQRGFSVAPVSVADLKDLTNARVLLDRELTGLSMRYGDDSWEAGILASFHRMERFQVRIGSEYYTEAEWVDLHSAFHLSLVCACQSPLLLEMRQTLFDRAHRYRRMASQFRTRWRPKISEHQAIRDSVLARSPAALDLIEHHIRETTDNVLEFAGHLFRQEQNEAAA